MMILTRENCLDGISVFVLEIDGAFFGWQNTTKLVQELATAIVLDSKTLASQPRAIDQGTREFVACARLLCNLNRFGEESGPLSIATAGNSQSTPDPRAMRSQATKQEAKTEGE